VKFIFNFNDATCTAPSASSTFIFPFFRLAVKRCRGKGKHLNRMQHFQAGGQGNGGKCPTQVMLKLLKNCQTVQICSSQKKGGTQKGGDADSKSPDYPAPEVDSSGSNK